MHVWMGVVRANDDVYLKECMVYDERLMSALGVAFE